jgi:hypothetical protein
LPFRILPMDEEVMPLPRPLMTPPVTITYFMMVIGRSNMLKHRCDASSVNRPSRFHPEDVDHLITIVDGTECTSEFSIFTEFFHEVVPICEIWGSFHGQFQIYPILQQLSLVTYCFCIGCIFRTSIL